MTGINKWYLSFRLSHLSIEGYRYFLWRLGWSSGYGLDDLGPLLLRKPVGNYQFLAHPQMGVERSNRKDAAVFVQSWIAIDRCSINGLNRLQILAAAVPFTELASAKIHISLSPLCRPYRRTILRGKRLSGTFVEWGVQVISRPRSWCLLSLSRRSTFLVQGFWNSPMKLRKAFS
jgi:hypothetical protein